MQINNSFKFFDIVGHQCHASRSGQTSYEEIISTKMSFSIAPLGGLHEHNATRAENMFVWKNWNNAVFNVCKCVQDMNMFGGKCQTKNKIG